MGHFPWSTCLIYYYVLLIFSLDPFQSYQPSPKADSPLAETVNHRLIGLWPKLRPHNYITIYTVSEN